MTYEEAIKELTHELSIWESECKSVHPMKESLRMAIKALEKQTPKKPKVEPFPIRYLIASGQIYICPTCGDSFNMNEYEMDYCWECGQRIDWSDTE